MASPHFAFSIYGGSRLPRSPRRSVLPASVVLRVTPCLTYRASRRLRLSSLPNGRPTPPLARGLPPWDSLRLIPKSRLLSIIRPIEHWCTSTAWTRDRSLLQPFAPPPRRSRSCLRRHRSLPISS